MVLTRKLEIVISSSNSSYWFHQTYFQVNQALLKLIRASEMKISPEDWTNLPEQSSGKHKLIKD